VTTYFTSDPHFGHRLVSRLRGFGEDTNAHDQALCDNWRKVVNDDDTVWVLGDLCMRNPSDALQIMKNLPGRKHFIAGNHDPCHPMHRDAHRWQSIYMGVFESVQPFARRRIHNQDVLLSHFPYEHDRNEARYMQYRLRNEGRWLLHGHTHESRILTSSREIHVGLDAWDLAPVTLDTIADLMRGSE